MPEQHDTPGEPGNGTPPEDAFGGGGVDVDVGEPLFDEDEVVEELLDDETGFDARADATASEDESHLDSHEPVGLDFPESDVAVGTLDDLEDDLDDGLLGDDAAETGAVAAGAFVGGIDPTASARTEARLERLERAARSLAAAEVVREGKRVRRKVTAATTGAGASGIVPIVLQLAGVLDLTPEMAAGVATAASLVGAWVAGWVTPERKPPLPAGAAHSLLRLGDERPGVRVE